MNKALALRYFIPQNSIASESGETAAAVSWIALQKDERLNMTFHPASEAKRSVVVGANLKMQGMLPGIPDLVNPVVPFMLELKVRKNIPSPYQAWWLIKGMRMGISCGVAYNADEAIEFFSLCLNRRSDESTASRRLLVMMSDWEKNGYVLDPWQSRMTAARRGR